MLTRDGAGLVNDLARWRIRNPLVSPPSAMKQMWWCRACPRPRATSARCGTSILPGLTTDAAGLLAMQVRSLF